MEVYPQRWVNKYLNMRSNDEIKGPLYNLVTQPENEVFRNQLNEWVNLLPKSAQNKIIPNLQNDNTLIEAYNELRVGDILRRQKYTLEYEKKIDDLTPDWYALDNNNIPFLVEVFSYRSSAVIQLFNKWLADLRDKLRQIPIRVGIHLESFPNPLEAFKIDFRPTRNTILAQELEVWLNQKPKAGETKIFKDMIITILNWNQNYTGIILHGPGYGIWIDEGSLREKIEAKVNKYSGIVQKYGLP